MRDWTRRQLVVGAAAFGLMLSLAAPSPLRAEGEALKVVATTGMIADAARRIGGDAVTVQALMGPGVDPHSYRQTRTDIVAMVNADLVLRHGLATDAGQTAWTALRRLAGEATDT